MKVGIPRAAGWLVTAFSTAVAAAGIAMNPAPAFAGPTAAGIGNADPVLQSRFDEAGPGGRVKAWVIVRRDRGLMDPANLEAALADVARALDPHARERRLKRRSRPGLVDVDDLPLPRAWVEAVRRTGAEIVIESRWAPGVSARVTREQAANVAALPFVTEVRAVARGPRRSLPVDLGGMGGTGGAGDSANPAAGGGPLADFYGEASPQTAQINVQALHSLGYTGSGVRIGVLDTGFRTAHVAFNHATHPLDVVAEWDFVNDDPETDPEIGDIFDQHEHGTLILGVIAAFWPNNFVGSAYDASYILAKVEDIAAEYPAEEDLFVAGLEFIEMNGGDVATSSVVIFNHYTQQQLDGMTSVMTLGMNTATGNGLIVLQGAGNDGHDSDPATSTLLPPADAFKGISVGSVDLDGTVAFFTSDGPTADGRTKPEIMARGVDTKSVSPFNNSQTTMASGASMATPLAAGGVACIVQARPAWSVDRMRTHLFLTANRYLSAGAPDPLFIEGFGLVDVLSAYDGDCNANAVEDSLDLGSGRSGDCNANGIPDECDVEALTSLDDNPDGLPDECTDCQTGPGCPAAVGMLTATAAFPHVVFDWTAAAGAAEYSVRRDETATNAGTTEIATEGSTQWTDANAMTGLPDLAFYVVRGLTVGGIAGP